MDNPKIGHANRRSDLAKEAIVKAATKLHAKLGYDVTFEFLVDAEIPLEVINRILNNGPTRLPD